MTPELLKTEADNCDAQSGLSPAPLLGFPPVLDACCGSRMFWFDRKTPQAIFVDKRTENHVLCDGRKLEIAPDVQADFTDLPFPDATFYLVVFDPPHMTTLGANSWMAKKYGRLTGDWKPMLKAGFEECFRVLKPNGTLVFKWNETDVKLKEVMELSPIPPLFGHTTGRQAKTVWATFLKPNGASGERNKWCSDMNENEIIVENETCLLHSDIDLETNKATAALEGYAKDAAGNEWELSAFVDVKWKRTATSFGKCDCGGNMVSKAPNNKNARVRCSKCGTERLLKYWRALMTPNEQAETPATKTHE